MKIAMAQVIVRHLEGETVRRLKERARRKGHSLEREPREILAAARQDMAEFKARAAVIRARHEGTPQTDSVCYGAKIVTGECRRRRQWAIGNIIWKRVRPGKLADGDGNAAFGASRSGPVGFVDPTPLVERAFALGPRDRPSAP